jgi:hypothetical protein
MHHPDTPHQPDPLLNLGQGTGRVGFLSFCDASLIWFRLEVAMIRRVVSVCLLMACLTLLCSALSGCSTTKPRRRGIKLSEATKEAKKKPEEQRDLQEGEADREGRYRSESSRDPDEETDSSSARTGALVEEEIGEEAGTADPSLAPVAGSAVAAGAIAATALTSEADNTEAREKAKEKERRHAMFGMFGLAIAGDAIQDYHGYLFEYGEYLMPRLRVVGGLYIADLHRGSARDIQAGIRDPQEFGLDVTVRYYLTPDKTFMGLYGLGGFRYGRFQWDYTNPIIVTNDDGDEERIRSDHMPIVQLYMGGGLSLVQTRGFHLGANLSAGFWGTPATTSEGFDNDIFESLGYFQLMVEASAFF